MDDFEAFARLIAALQPWIDQLVFVGGWAHRLHRLHPLANPPGHLALRTRDADLAFSSDAALAGDVRGALTGARFTEELLGDDAPPATHYRLGENDGGFYAKYIHDTLELFGGSLGELRHLWLEEVRPVMAPKTARKAEMIAQELFVAVTETIREATRIPQDRRLTPEGTQRACIYGLAEILGIPDAD